MQIKKQINNNNNTFFKLDLNFIGKLNRQLVIENNSISDLDDLVNNN